MTNQVTTTVAPKDRSLRQHNVRVEELRTANASVFHLVKDEVAKIGTDTSSAKRMEILFGLLYNIRARYQWDVKIGESTFADVVVQNEIEDILVKAFFTQEGEYIVNINFRGVFRTVLS